jgi:hypothetical protein
MKKAFLTLAVFSALLPSAFSAAFTAGNLVVYRVGDGVGTLSSASQAVFLDEYTSLGTLVQSIAVPTSFSSAGTSSSEGFLNLSPNGSYLAIPGYSAPVGTLAIAGTAAATFARGALVYSAAGTSTGPISFGTNFSGVAIRSAVSLNGTDAYAVGAATGVVYDTTIVSTTVTNNRVVNVQGGQLYSSDASGSAVRIGTVGTGTPTTTGQTIVSLPGVPTSGGSPYAFAFADLSSSVAGLDTLYVADDGGATGILKYSLVSGTWTLNGNVTAAGVRGLTLSVNASTGAVSLFGTTGGTAAAGGGSIYSFTDSTGFNGAFSGTAASIATAVTNTAFRGVAYVPGTTVNVVYAPIPEPGEYAVAIAVMLGAVIVMRRRRMTA